MNQNVLVGTDVVDEKSIRALSRYSRVYKLADLTEDRLNQVLPSIHCLVVFSWPNQLTSDRLQKMTSLLFIQSILAGVNHIPFASLNKNVIVSSNAGAYSDEVAEYAWALLLSAAKRVVELHVSLREQKWTLKRTLDEGSEITILRDFFFNDTATTEIYTLSLHDALPICTRLDLPAPLGAETTKRFPG